MYPHFKVGEIWTEIKQELTEEVLFIVKTKASQAHFWWPTLDDDSNRGVLRKYSQLCQHLDPCIFFIFSKIQIAKEHKRYQEEELTKFYEIIRSNKISKWKQI